MDDGQPLPPLILDGVVWRVVRRLADARTRWRRIALAENPADPTAARSRGTSSHGGRHVTKTYDTKIHAQDNAKTMENQDGHAQVQRPDLHQGP